MQIFFGLLISDFLEKKKDFVYTRSRRKYFNFFLNQKPRSQAQYFILLKKCFFIPYRFKTSECQLQLVCQLITTCWYHIVHPCLVTAHRLASYPIMVQIAGNYSSLISLLRLSHSFNFLSIKKFIVIRIAHSPISKSQ